jgi:hypothetical protein
MSGGSTVLTPEQIQWLLYLIEAVVDVSVATNQLPLVKDVLHSAIAKHPDSLGYWQFRAILDLGARLGIFTVTQLRNDPDVQKVKVNAGNFIQTSGDVALLRAAAGAYCFCATSRDPGPDCTIEAQWDFVRARLLGETCIESVNGVVTGARSPVGCPCRSVTYG